MSRPRKILYRGSFKCPKCGEHLTTTQTSVCDNLPEIGHYVYRDKRCINCEFRSYSFEVLTESWNKIMDAMEIIDKLQGFIKKEEGI